MSEVKDNSAASRFEMATGDAVAFVEYTRAGDRIVLTHTEVPEALSGQGRRLQARARHAGRGAGERLEGRAPLRGSWPPTSHATPSTVTCWTTRVERRPSAQNLMVPKPLRPLLVTHSGTFHLDDAFAYAVLRLAFGLSKAGVDHALVRTRDEAVVAGADIAWDVGAVHDPAAGRFDHHQRGAPVRDDGLPYSAAGLVWRRYGEAAVRALLAPCGAADLAAAVAAGVDREVVRRIDEIDNGVGPPGDALGLASLVEDLNPTWDSPVVGDRAAEDAAFLRAADLAGGFLRRRAEAVRARLAAEAVVLAAHARSADPRVLELGRKLPWEGPVFAHALPCSTPCTRFRTGTGWWTRCRRSRLLRAAVAAAGGVGGAPQRRPHRGERRA
jgi:uncharacterized UPF0160 family protein